MVSPQKLVLFGILSAMVCAVFMITKDRAPAIQRSPRADLLRALGALRPVHGRIAGLAYATYPTNLGGARGPRRLSQMRAASRRINQELSNSPQAITRSNQALLKLADGNLAAALQDLEEAVQLAPGEGLLRSDLCALYLEQAKRGSPEGLFDALTAAHLAVDLSPDCLPARFNLALALEENGLREMAGTAWKDYLHRDPGSPWATEARYNLALVERLDDAQQWEQLRAAMAVAAARGELSVIQMLSRRFPGEVARYAEEMLEHWAEAFERGDLKAAEAALTTARLLGNAVVLTSSVSMTSAAVAVLDRLYMEPASRQVRLLKLAHAQNGLTAGKQLCLNQGNGGPARLESSRAAFAEIGSPLEYQAIYFLAVCSYEHARYDDAIAQLTSLLGRLDARGYTGLAGKASSIIGLCYLASGRPDLSLRAYQAAEQNFKLSGSTDEIGYAAYLLSENLRYLGEKRESLRLLQVAVADAVKTGSTRSLYRAFDGLAEEASRRGALRVALDFRHKVLGVAQRAAEQTKLQEAGLAHAWLRQGEARLALSDVVGAREDLAEASYYTGQISDVDAMRIREADLLLAQGRLLLASDPKGALRLLTTAIQEKLKAQSLFFLLEALYTHARAELALGNRAAAARNIAVGLQEFEKQRVEVVSLSLRASYLDRMGQFFDLAIKLAAEEPDGAAAALALAEQERARSLLDLTRSAKVAENLTSSQPAWASVDRASAKPLSVNAIMRRLPDGVAVVEYAVLTDRLLVWLLRHGNVATLVESRIGSQRIAALVRRFRQSLEDRELELGRDAAGVALFEILLRPVLLSLHAGERLVFVPDSSLLDLPFAALFDPRTHRYLIEDHGVAVAPSATFFLEGLERASTVTQVSKLDVLALGNPSLDRKLYPGMDDLPGSATEASAVAAVYGAAAELRLGRAASRRALLENAGKHVVVHIASHALANPDFPSLSRLLLAPSDGGSGDLFASDIEKSRFPATQLVVLAACGSSRGEAEGREGAQGMGWAFLAAGVPAVVASLWNVDDLDARSLLTEFHRQFYSTRDALEALRRAQLALLHSPNRTLRSPSAWANFELLGGSAVTP
jgi:CHAT domain-containing protein/tetratricopeptide (TPR) repeat protein